MATVYTSNYFKYKLAKKKADLELDTFKGILMKRREDFSYDKDLHDKYTQISGEELPTGGGYVQGGQTLGKSSFSRDDDHDVTKVIFNYVVWTGSGETAPTGPEFSGEYELTGDERFGPTGTFIIYDDSIADKPIVGAVEFTQNYTVELDQSFKLKNLKIKIA